MHDKQRTSMSFQLGNRGWLHLDKKCFKGKHHRLLPIRYVPYTILEQIGENAYWLDLPPQLGIQNIINVNHLKLFEHPLLEEPVTITHLVENILDFQCPLKNTHYWTPRLVLPDTRATPPTLWHAKDKLQFRQSGWPPKWCIGCILIFAWKPGRFQI